MTREPYHASDGVTLYTGDAAEVLAELPDASVSCVVTSPPYWGLRDYGTGSWIGGDPACAHSAGRGTDTAQTKQPAVGYPASAAHRGGNPRVCRRCGALRQDGQYGLEPTPDSYVDNLRAVFTQVRRVLASDGTVWLNLGDSYSSAPPGGARDPMRTSTLTGRSAAATLRKSVRLAKVDSTRQIPRKNLIGMPWRVAFALQADGWIIRNAIVWHKPNAMPESATDRLSTRYEMLFLLAARPRYYFDLDPIREPLARPEALGEGIVMGGPNKGQHAGIGATRRRRGASVYGAAKYHDLAAFAGNPPGAAMRPGQRHNAAHPAGRNPGDVWSISTRPLREAHFAAFPVDVPLRCIAAGCRPGGTVLDPFSGASTTGLAARQLDHPFVGIDLNAAFHDIALARLGLDADHPGQGRRAA